MHDRAYCEPMRFFVALLVVLAAPLEAQSPNERFARRNDAPFDAIGRIANVAPQSEGFCSGALIDSDLVLTAAHCVISQQSGKTLEPKFFRFLAGLGRPDSEVRRRVISVSVESGFVGKDWSDDFENDQTMRNNYDTDIALLRLDRPIDTEMISPLTVTEKEVFAGPVVLSGYPGTAPVLKHYQGCFLFHLSSRRFSTNCLVEPGVSGAPLIGEIDGAWQIVGVSSIIRSGTIFMRTFGPRVTKSRIDQITSQREREKEPFNSGKRSGKRAVE